MESLGYNSHMKIYGIDIGSQSIKIVGLTPLKNSAEVTEYHVFDLKPDPNKDSKLEIIDILRNFSDDHDPQQTHYVLGLSQKNISHRKVEFPFKERHNIMKSIGFELEEEIPLSIENAIFETKITSYSEDGAQVLATAAPKAAIQEVLSLCQDSGIQPHILSTEGLAFSNLFENWLELPPERKQLDQKIPEAPQLDLLIHFGHSHSLVLIYQGAELIDVRHLLWGSEKLSLAISQVYNIPPTEAQKQVRKKGFILLDPEGATKDQVAFSDLIKKSLTPLAKDLLLLCLELKGEHDTKINKISISGGPSNLKNLAGFLTQNLELSVQQTTPSDPYVSNRVNDFDHQQGAIALGLALEALKKPRNPATNLLKDEFARGSSNFKVFWKKWSYAAKLATAALFLLYVYSGMKESASLEISSQADSQFIKLAKSVANAKSSSKRLKEVNNYIKNQEKKIKHNDLLEKLDEINSALDILGSVSRATPASKKLQLDLKVFDLKGEDLRLEGILHKASFGNQLQKALKAISKNNKLKVIKPSKSYKIKNGQKAFAYKFKVSRQEGNQ